MSERSRHLPRRSCLSVPASSQKMLAKAQGLAADMVVVDLEDAVAPFLKAAARDNAREAVAKGDWGDKIVGVRLNGWDSPWTYLDVIRLAEDSSERLDTLVLPKVESAVQVHALDLLLTQIERSTGRSNRVGIEALIETAQGLTHVDEICAASDRLEAVIFGPADFAASVEMPLPTDGRREVPYPGDPFHYVFCKILVAGRANGLQVIDGPYLNIRDTEGLRELANRTRILGYDGKWALHPDQVVACNEVFTPTQEQFDRAWDILETYRRATDEQRLGAVLLGDEMIDEASRKMASKFVTRGERGGMSRSSIQ